MARIIIHNHRLNAVQAELWLRGKAGELSGRFVGPRCRYASTIEVSYPLQPFQSPNEGEFTLRVLIPEPSLWTPEMPFVYRVEVRSGETRLQFEHGLRLLEIRRAGCRLNGQPFKFAGIASDSISEAAVTAARAQGLNTLLTSLSSLEGGNWVDACRLCDTVGAFLFLELQGDDLDDSLDVPATTPASLAGWLLPQSAAESDAQHPATMSLVQGGQSVGIRMTAVPRVALPDWVAFVACSRELCDHLQHLTMPRLILDCREDASGFGILGEIWS